MRTRGRAKQKGPHRSANDVLEYLGMCSETLSLSRKRWLAVGRVFVQVFFRGAAGRVFGLKRAREWAEEATYESLDGSCVSSRFNVVDRAELCFRSTSWTSTLLHLHRTHPHSLASHLLTLPTTFDPFKMPGKGKVDGKSTSRSAKAGL